VHLTRGRSMAFAGAMAFPDDSRAIGMHGDPDSGDINRQEGAPVFTGILFCIGAGARLQLIAVLPMRRMIPWALMAVTQSRIAAWGRSMPPP
jgi:hypothetical protein